MVPIVNSTMKLIVLLLCLIVSGCGVSGTPTVTYTKPEPRITAVEAVKQPERAQIVKKPTVELPAKPEIKTQNEVERQLTTASLAFNVPESANIKDEFTVQLLVNQVLTPKELSKELRPSNRTVETKIKVSKILVAKITGPGFDITPVTPEEQALAGRESTEWLWRLKAKTPGEHTINVSVVAVVEVDGKKMAERHIKTFDHQITITIKTGQAIEDWLKKYWQWLVSTLLLPLVVWGWKTWKKPVTR